MFVDAVAAFGLYQHYLIACFFILLSELVLALLAETRICTHFKGILFYRVFLSLLLLFMLLMLLLLYNLLYLLVGATDGEIIIIAVRTVIAIVTILLVVEYVEILTVGGLTHLVVHAHVQHAR